MSEPIYHGYTESEAQTENRYNRRCAFAAYARLVKALGQEKADKFIGREMLTCSWKEIRTALEAFADLAEKQVAAQLRTEQVGESPNEPPVKGDPAHDQFSPYACYRSDAAEDYAERRDLYTMGMGG